MRLLRRCGWFGGLGVPVLVTVLLELANPAEAAFPGRNGLLAVQPLSGSGVVLVNANGSGMRRVCPSVGQGPPCAELSASPRPAWSRDGRTLVISATYPSRGLLGGSLLSVIYPDGSCLDCWTSFYGLAAVGEAAFTSDPTLFTAVVSPFSLGTTYGPSAAGLDEFSFDGLLRSSSRPLVSGMVSDPAWSSRGELAIVRGRWIWIGRPGKLRRLTPGSAPSWSPGGKQIVFTQGAWVRIVRVRGSSVRRLVQGTSPAWSPDGRWIAFFGKSHRLNVIGARGGRVRHVPGVSGRSVDWQPVPAQPPTPCRSPPWSTLLASSDTAVVSVDSGVAPAHGELDFWSPAQDVMGCLRADGRERLLQQELGAGRASDHVAEAAVAGNYAALASNSVGFGFMATGVRVFDLRTANNVPGRGGEDTHCGGIGVSCKVSMDQLVLGSDAVTAVHTTVQGQDMNGSSCTCTVEQIQASDSTGGHTLDSITQPDGSPTALTNLTLTGDTLTWEHNGTPRSAQLQP